MSICTAQLRNWSAANLFWSKSLSLLVGRPVACCCIAASQLLPFPCRDFIIFSLLQLTSKSVSILQQHHVVLRTFAQAIHMIHFSLPLCQSDSCSIITSLYLELFIKMVTNGHQLNSVAATGRKKIRYRRATKCSCSTTRTAGRRASHSASSARHDRVTVWTCREIQLMTLIWSTGLFIAHLCLDFCHYFM